MTFCCHLLKILQVNGGQVHYDDISSCTGYLSCSTSYFPNPQIIPRSEAEAGRPRKDKITGCHVPVLRFYSPKKEIHSMKQALRETYCNDPSKGLCSKHPVGTRLHTGTNSIALHIMLFALDGSENILGYRMPKRKVYILFKLRREHYKFIHTHTRICAFFSFPGRVFGSFSGLVCSRQIFSHRGFFGVWTLVFHTT